MIKKGLITAGYVALVVLAFVFLHLWAIVVIFGGLAALIRYDRVRRQNRVRAEAARAGHPIRRKDAKLIVRQDPKAGTGSN